MEAERWFRAAFVASGVGLFAIRIYYQAKVRKEAGHSLRQQGERGMLFGGLAAVVTITFGLVHIFFPGRPEWAYALHYPDAVRWAGVILLSSGVLLLFLAQHHLALNFSSFVRVREGHTLVQSGPYRWIRHPIYTAYFMNYVGGGLVSANWVLTFVPFLFFAAMIALRVGEEERMMIGQLGERYEQYMRRTGRLVPRLGLGGPSDEAGAESAGDAHV